MSLNFNVEPYYDDFDQSKNFHRILFKPGFAVQARELTQAQTILQSQISKFADNIFTQNTPVTGGKVTTNLNCYYLKLNRQYNNLDIDVDNFLNKVIQDSTGTILAKVVKTVVATGTEEEAGDPPTLIVTYLSGSRFTESMNVFPADGSNFAATIVATNGTGLSSVASISEGVFYIVNGYSQSYTQNEDGTFSNYSIGNFVSVQPQTIVLDKYSDTPSYRIGLSIDETIVDYINDSSLLDPAVGSSNNQAPGADRYKISLTLTTLPLSLGNDDQFVELVRIDEGNIVKQVDNTVYSVIDDYFAKRTHETNGDYIVNDFKITPSANTINANTYILSVGPGVAYVQGYRAENQSTIKIDSNRSRQTESVNNNGNFIDYGNYLYIDNLKGRNGNFFDITTGDTVDFHTVGPENINRSNTTSYNATLAGSGFIRNLSYVQSSNTANSQTYVYKAHLFDISNKVLSGTISSATSTTITFNTSGGNFSNIANAYIGCTLTINSGVDSGDTKQIISYDGSTRTAVVDSPFIVTPNASDSFSIRFAVKDFECMVQPVPDTPYLLDASASMSSIGKTNNVPSGFTQLYNTNNTQLIFPLGNPYVATVTDSSYVTTQQFRAQSFGSYSTGSRRYLQLDVSATGTFDFIRTGATESSDAIKQNWVVVVTDRLTNTTIQNGDIIDFTAAGRSIAVDSNKNGVYLTALDLNPFIATIFVRLNVTNGNDTNLVLKTKTLIEANTQIASSAGPDGIISNTYIDLTNAQLWIPEEGVVNYGVNQSMYVSDVTRIVKIIDTGGLAPNVSLLTTGSDVTNYYNFNNGQTDNYYGHSYISLRPGRPKPKSLWILFDYYEHSGGDGYFSAQSYNSVDFTERPTYFSTNRINYELKDCLDFRPAVKNAQPNFTFRYKITPTSTNSSGLFLPADLSSFVSDYSYYLGRKDVLIIGKDKTIKLIEGKPAVNPVLPVVPEGSLVLANISLDPYTAYVPGQVAGKASNVNIQPVLHKRWAFSDISDLQTRVNNLEYYASLNLLEQKASSLQITDANGLNRFKNGILVDDFSTYSVGSTFNPDFSAAINTRLQYLSPALLVKNYPLQNQQTLNTNSLARFSDATLAGLSYVPAQNGGQSPSYMLKYTETELAAQPLASRSMSVNPFATPSSVGVVELTPPIDNWVDNTELPELLFVDPNLKTYLPSSTLNLLEGNPTLAVADWQTVPGTTVTTSYTESGDDGYGGFFTGDTVTTTTATKQNIYTYGYWSQSYNQTSSYITNVSILPYIRGQYIMFQAKGMLFNTTVNAFFDEKRVTRLIRKPNIIELTGVTGAFKAGDIIGYVSSSVFYKTGFVIDVYKYANGNVRLYVVQDLDTTSYGAIVVNATFNTSGVYQGSTASGTRSSTVHYSGKTVAVGTNTNTINLSSSLASTTDIYTGMDLWIVAGSATGISSIPNGSKATISAYNTTTKVATLDRNISYSVGDTYSIGPLTTNEIGNISGIFCLPGGYFHTGERLFRLDNRIVTQGASDFFYNNGSETTYAEAKFRAQGLATKSQDVNYSASISSAKNTQTTINTQTGVIIKQTRTSPPSGGGGCCVMATALNSKGIWSDKQKNTLIEWCEKYLHNKSLGECFRRGYQVIGSKLLVPALRSDNKLFEKYATWSWNNGTQMVMGKKFNPLSIPNSMFWITAFMAVGAVVTTNYAKKCWKKLYE
jgi:hypothetical protein